MTTSTEMQVKVDKTITNMDRIDDFVNGGPDTTVELDGGASVPSLQKLVDLAGVIGGSAETALEGIAENVAFVENALARLKPHIELVIQPDAGLYAGAWYGKFFMPGNTNCTKLRLHIYSGTGTCKVYVNVNDSNVLGPFTATTTSTTFDIALTVADGQRVSFQITDITGTPMGIAVQMEGPVE